MDDYYRIVIENGKIKINVFEKNNHVPNYTLNTDITKKKGRELVAMFLQKYGMNIEEFKKTEDENAKLIKEDIKKMLEDYGI